jgi:hypothetical protein
LLTHDQKTSFCFRYKKQNDIKLIVNSCTNIIKLFSALIKQSRLRIINSAEQPTNLAEIENVNNWLTSLFSGLKSNQTNNQELELTNMNDLTKYWHSFMTSNQTVSSASTASQVENTLKLLQLQSQFLSFIVQNSFEFDLFNTQLNQNGQQHLGTSTGGGGSDKSNMDFDSDCTNGDIMPSQSQQANKIGDKFAKKNSQAPVNYLAKFVDLVELLKQLIQLFYYFIQSQPTLSQSIGKVSLSDDHEYGGQKFEFVDKQGNSRVYD